MAEIIHPRQPTLPQRVKIIFSDLDGTLVHFEKYFRPHGVIQSIDEATGTAVYRCNDGPSIGQTSTCRLLPTLTMGPGLFSDTSAELISQLRQQGVIFVYVTGARKSTMIKRLPLLAAADYAVAETGGRMYITNGSTDPKDATLDEEWTRRIESVCGPIDGEEEEDVIPVEKRQGALWDWCRELTKRGVPCDTRNYTCSFRIDCAKPLLHNKYSTAPTETVLSEAIETAMPAEGVTCAQNLGKYDFFPSISGKGEAVKYLLQKLGIDRDDAVALFDDENDLPMANACAHGCVMRCTHESIAARLAQNPHWHTATEAGVLATEQILQMLLDNVVAANQDGAFSGK